MVCLSLSLTVHHNGSVEVPAGQLGALLLRSPLPREKATEQSAQPSEFSRPISLSLPLPPPLFLFVAFFLWGSITDE